MSTFQLAVVEWSLLAEPVNLPVCVCGFVLNGAEGAPPVVDLKKMERERVDSRCQVCVHGETVKKVLVGEKKRQGARHARKATCIGSSRSGSARVGYRARFGKVKRKVVVRRCRKVYISCRSVARQARRNSPTCDLPRSDASRKNYSALAVRSGSRQHRTTTCLQAAARSNRWPFAASTTWEMVVVRSAFDRAHPNGRTSAF
jgi:hypothetical protein